MSKTKTYEEACELVVSKGCTPLFTKEEWKGVRPNKSLMKYWFKDKLGHNFYATYNNVVYGTKQNCNECGNQNQLNKQKLSKLEYNTYNEDFKTNKQIIILTDYCDYKNIRQKLKCKCLICNGDFEINIDNLIQKESHGCIKLSKGEKIAITYFEKHGIDYEHQVYIPSLNLTSDFEIKLQNNHIVHLELDGDQHYHYPNEFHKTYEDFVKAQQRDVRKDQWYSDNGYTNLHIRYNVNGKHNEDIESILMNIINGEYGECLTKEKNINFNIIDLLNVNFKGKKVVCYTLEGKLFKIFNSMLEAENELGVNNSSVSGALNGRLKTNRVGNYMFKAYTVDYSDEIPPYKNPASKTVYVYKKGNLIEELSSLRLVIEKYNIHASTLCRYLNGKGKNPLCEQYDFKYQS